MNTDNNETIKDQEIRDLVKERLKTFPSGRKISIGSDGDFSKERLIEAIDKHEAIGDKIISIQLNYLRALKEGFLVD